MMPFSKPLTPIAAMRSSFVLSRLVVLSGLLLFGGCAGGTDAEGDSSPAVAEDGLIRPEPYAAPSFPTIPVEVQELFPDVGRRGLVFNNCATCHAVACLALGQRTPEEWAFEESTHQNAIPGMSKEDLGKAFDYLKRHFNDQAPEPSTKPEWLAGQCRAKDAIVDSATPPLADIPTGPPGTVLVEPRTARGGN
jgi:hypothetical protein